MSYDGVTRWSVSVTRDRGGERWKLPRVQAWRGETGWHFRVGWRFTAWGLHLTATCISPPVEEGDDR